MVRVIIFALICAFAALAIGTEEGFGQEQEQFTTTERSAYDSLTIPDTTERFFFRKFKCRKYRSKVHHLNRKVSSLTATVTTLRTTNSNLRRQIQILKSRIYGGRDAYYEGVYDDNE